jgi:hypothetical protein
VAPKLNDSSLPAVRLSSASPVGGAALDRTVRVGRRKYPGRHHAAATCAGCPLRLVRAIFRNA